MRPGRLPEDHPLEQQAREKLRDKTPEAIAATLTQATTDAAPALQERPATGTRKRSRIVDELHRHDKPRRWT